MTRDRLTGLVAAPYTPFGSDGDVNVAVIPDYARMLAQNGVSGAFVCGTTGESLSLTPEERMAVAEAWLAAAPSELKMIVHVGSASVATAKRLAGHAQDRGAWGIGSMAPVFLKPKTVEDLVAFCADIAEAAPDLPFYFYHIPSMTGVNVKMADFLGAAKDRIPNLAGVKYTYEDLMDLQLSRAIDGGRFDMLFGRDELLICGLALGCTGAIGSTYNYLAPLYVDLQQAFEQGDLEEANRLQLISMRVIQVLFRHGDPLVCGKAIMRMIGVDCGPVRLPLRSLSADSERRLAADLRSVGFFDYCAGQGQKRLGAMTLGGTTLTKGTP